MNILEKQKMQKLKDLIAHNKAKENCALQLTNKKVAANSQYSMRHDKVNRDLMQHKNRIKQLEMKE